MPNNWPGLERIVAAERLRRYADISIAKSRQKNRNSSDSSQNNFEELKKKFIESEFLESEFEALERQIINAARRGQYEVEVMKFPGAFCSDGGRSINNSEKTWPQSLQGRAKSFYLIWKDCGQPNGYRLMAKILDYPKGFIGEVCLFINWS
jgi:hypothetical protein